MASQVSMFMAGGVGPLPSGPSRPLSEVVPSAPRAPEVQPSIVSKPMWEDAVMLNLRITTLGTSRKVGSDAVKADGVDKTMLHISKEILESKKLDAIGSLDGAIQSRIRKLSIPSMFKRGVYLVALLGVERVDAELLNYERERLLLVSEFLEEYESAKVNARFRLGPLFDESDYPDVEKVRKAFSVSWSWFEFAAPGRLATISPALLKREQEKAASTIRDAVAESVGLLRDEFAKLVSHMVERLTPDADGKAKIFKDSSVKNLQEFLELFSIRNLSGDTDLNALVDQARKLVSGVSPSALRDGGSFRGTVRAGFSQIKSELDKLVVTAPSRRVVLDDSLENI